MIQQNSLTDIGYYNDSVDSTDFNENQDQDCSIKVPSIVTRELFGYNKKDTEIKAWVEYLITDNAPANDLNSSTID